MNHPLVYLEQSDLGLFTDCYSSLKVNASLVNGLL
jgi:hypothetical protein